MLVPSDAVTVNVDVVLVLLGEVALPEKTPLEPRLIPAGSEPAVTENVIVSPSSSVAVIAVILEPAV